MHAASLRRGFLAHCDSTDHDVLYVFPASRRYHMLKVCHYLRSVSQYAPEWCRCNTRMYRFHDATDRTYAAHV